MARDEAKKDSSKEKGSYLTDTGKWTIEIPIWIPGFRGDFAYGEVEIEGEDGTIPKPEQPIHKPGFGDVFKRLFRTRFDLNYFFVSGVSYANNRFYSEMDVFSGALGSSLIFRTNNYKLVKANARADLVRLYFGYNVIDTDLSGDKAHYELCTYAGTRWHNFKVSTKLNDFDVSLRIDPTWTEPVLGLRNELYFDKFRFIVQGDMGSFWIDGKYSFMLNLHGFVRLGDLVSVKLGWNSWYVYYKDRLRDERLRIKTHLAGPLAAVAFNF